MFCGLTRGRGRGIEGKAQIHIKVYLDKVQSGAVTDEQVVLEKRGALLCSRIAARVTNEQWSGWLKRSNPICRDIFTRHTVASLGSWRLRNLLLLYIELLMRTISLRFRLHLHL